MSFRRTYRAAAVSFADLVSRVPGELWPAPALGDWTLRDLVTHTAGSALRQVPDVLANPAASVTVATAEGFFAYARNAPANPFAAAPSPTPSPATFPPATSPPAVPSAAAFPPAASSAAASFGASSPAADASAADAGINAAWLGDDPASLVNELVGRATAALSAVADDDVITTAAGGMRVRDWLPTRTFELVVHGLDAAATAGVEHRLPLDAIAESTMMAARLAVALGDGPAVLRALTGRGPLSEKYSVI